MVTQKREGLFSAKNVDPAFSRRLASLYRNEAPWILATLIRLFGDFDLGEEGLQEAFKAALEQWPQLGVPDNPRSWLIYTARFKTIDKIRREYLFSTPDEWEEQHSATPIYTTLERDEHLEDDRLRLIFTCCHPCLPVEAQTALILKEIGGLTIEEIARAFLVAPKTMSQRIVKAKAKIRDAAIPYQIPEPMQFSERLDKVLHVIYQVFNEGYSAPADNELIRKNLATEAIRLGRLLTELLPDTAEILGLLALMLLQDSRRNARISADGELVLLDEQDRSLWNRSQIHEGTMLVRKAFALPNYGIYSLQAAIAAVHTEALHVSATDWQEITGLYDALLQRHPSPLVELNRAIAIAMRDGPEAGLHLVESLLRQGRLLDYPFIYIAKADFHRRLGQTASAATAYRLALELAQQEPERRFLERRLAELSK